MMRNNVYKESQGFMTWWLGVLLVAIFSYEVYKNYHLGVAFWILLIVIVGFLLIRLHTTIDSEGIQITFIPFAYKKKWLWNEMDEVYVRKYAITDFGGWGYRISGEGTAYNTKGNIGIQMVLKNGKRILIGTQYPDDVKGILDLYFNKTNDQANIVSAF